MPPRKRARAAAQAADDVVAVPPEVVDAEAENVPAPNGTLVNADLERRRAGAKDIARRCASYHTAGTCLLGRLINLRPVAFTGVRHTSQITLPSRMRPMQTMCMSEAPRRVHMLPGPSGLAYLLLARHHSLTGLVRTMGCRHAHWACGPARWS